MRLCHVSRAFLFVVLASLFLATSVSADTIHRPTTANETQLPVVLSSSESVSTDSPSSDQPVITKVAITEGATDLFAIIELGSSGIRCLVRRIPEGGEAPQTIYKFSPRTVRPIAPENVEGTLAEVSSLVQQVQSDHQVAAKNIYIIGSSGLGEGPTAQTLAAEIKKAVNMDIKFVTVDEEIRYQYIGMVGTDALDRATIIDIGGGNTKASYYQKVDGVPSIATIRLADGVRALTTKGGETTPLSDFMARIAAIEKNELKKEVCTIVDTYPAFATRPNVYLTGGMCWVIASALAPPDSELADGPVVVELSAPEIAVWINAVSQKPQLAYMYRKDRVRAGGESFAEDNLRNIESTFTPAQIASGVAILRTLSTCLDFPNRSKILFHRDSLHAWPQACLDQLVADSRSGSI